MSNTDELGERRSVITDFMSVSFVRLPLVRVGKSSIICYTRSFNVKVSAGVR